LNFHFNVDIDKLMKKAEDIIKLMMNFNS